MSDARRFWLIVLLMVGIFGLITLLVFHPDADQMFFGGIVTALIAILVFTFHTLFPAMTHPTGPQTGAKENP